MREQVDQAEHRGKIIPPNRASANPICFDAQILIPRLWLRSLVTSDRLRDLSKLLNVTRDGDLHSIKDIRYAADWVPIGFERRI